MNCPRCRTLVLAEDVNLEHLLAKCRHCQEVFRFSVDEIEAVTEKRREREAMTERESTREGPEDHEPRLPIVRAPRPSNIVVEDWGPDRRIYKRWFEYHHLGMVVFCVFWDGFLVMWYTMVFVGNGPWIAGVFPLLHVAAGITITYSTLAGLLNRTIIRVTERVIEVKHGPMPWYGNVVVPISQIEQLYCMPATPTTWSYNRGMVPQPVHVHVFLGDGEQQTILRSLPAQEGLFIEHVLEDWLKIRPQRVPGQVD